MEKNVMEILDKYIKELEADTQIDQLNLKEVQLKLPSYKHKWVARLINHKNEVNKLQQAYRQAKENIVESMSKNQAIGISKATLEKTADNNDVVKKISARIDEEQLIVLYLEKVEVVLRSMTYDVKNLVDIMKLEET